MFFFSVSFQDFQISYRIESYRIESYLISFLYQFFHLDHAWSSITTNQEMFRLEVCPAFIFRAQFTGTNVAVVHLDYTECRVSILQCCAKLSLFFIQFCKKVIHEFTKIFFFFFFFFFEVESLENFISLAKLWSKQRIFRKQTLGSRENLLG